MNQDTTGNTGSVAPEARSSDEQVAFEEIDLYAELVIAAEASDGPLSFAQIDQVLGVRHDREA